VNLTKNEWIPPRNALCEHAKEHSTVRACHHRKYIRVGWELVAGGGANNFFICRIATALTIVLLGGSGSGAFHQLPLGHAWHRALPLIPVLVLDVSENTLQMGSTLSRAVHGIVKRNAPTLHLNHYQNPVHQIKVDGDIYFVKFKYIGNCQTGSSG